MIPPALAPSTVPRPRGIGGCTVNDSTSKLSTSNLSFRIRTIPGVRVETPRGERARYHNSLHQICQFVSLKVLMDRHWPRPPTEPHGPSHAMHPYRLNAFNKTLDWRIWRA